ncbi:MAG: FHA domain-containing protein [Muribaculaceae bacterium]|nr:FHA domain-containing protein [Muribaculaceae bacterium]
MEIIIGRQGTQKTPITDPTVSRRHCKVTVNGDGSYTLENLSQSGTIVNGNPIIRATVGPDTRIQLGQSYSATLGELIGLSATKSSHQTSATPSSSVPAGASGGQQSASPKTYSITHLQHVWNDFNNTNLEMENTQRRTNLVRAGLGIFTMCAMPLCYFFGPVGYVLTAVGILGNIYSFVGIKNAETAEERQSRRDAFDDAWICPNPECGHSLMAKNYRMLVRNHQSCPYCKCKYIEK